ncbi:hypothetical protein DPMN_103836 [Dreissena polymorpha]|uniref:Uncharacterized protein n=1 Tax=Dreissena polymorpha TaxID=45954 RepID=A0A9D4HBU8_DREPO|nr:hypothetical protein DPMN_103836 [Dreissena polymorpha]
MMTFRDFRLPLGVCLCFLVCRTTISTSTDNPTECDFDQSTLCGYTQDKTDNFDWIWYSGHTTSADTGPNNDHTTGKSTGHYMYIETSLRYPNAIARLISPSYHLKGSGIQCLTFWYSMYGSTIKTLNVYVTASGHTNNRGSPAWTLSGNQGDQWKQAKFTIFPTGNYQIVFEGISGDYSDGDIAIDDIMVTIGDCNTTDCGPWPGLANSSVNQKVTYLNSTLFGAIVLMTCDAGYHVFNNSSSHNESAVCTLNGTWSPSTYSQCIPIDCGQWSSNSSVRSHQKIIYTNATVFGSEVVMKCNQGYHVFNTNKSRTESAVCQENGTWSSKTYSECVPTDCGEWSTNSSALANHNIIYPNSTSYGSQAVMTCDPGYHIVNKAGTRSESAVCTENGIWSTQTFSDCIPIEETMTTTIDFSYITDVTTSKKIIETAFMNTHTMSAPSVSHLGPTTQSTMVDTTYEETAKSNIYLNIIVPSLISLLVIISIIVVILVCQRRIKKTKNRKQSNAAQDSTYCTISTPRNEEPSYSSLHTQSVGGLQEIIPMTIRLVLLNDISRNSGCRLV